MHARARVHVRAHVSVLCMYARACECSVHVHTHVSVLCMYARARECFAHVRARAQQDVCINARALTLAHTHTHTHTHTQTFKITTGDIIIITNRGSVVYHLTH